MVVLHEAGIDPRLTEGALIPAFEKEAARIAVQARLEDEHVRDGGKGDIHGCLARVADADRKATSTSQRLVILLDIDHLGDYSHIGDHQLSEKHDADNPGF